MQEGYKHSMGKRAQDMLAVVLFLLYASLVFIKMCQVFFSIWLTVSWWGALALGSAFFVGYVLADFLSGVVHYLGDTFGSEQTPLFGKAFIFPFREHHVDPNAITRHDFWYVNGMNCLVSLPVLLVLYYLIPVDQVTGVGVFLFVVVYVLVIGIFLTNQIHKYAHMDVPPSWIRVLQRWRLVLSPEHHAKHHTAPFASYFCITTGWVNHLTESVGFFQRLTRWVKKT